MGTEVEHFVAQRTDHRSLLSIDVHAVAWVHRGPAVKTCPPPGRPNRPGLYHEAQFPSVRVGRTRPNVHPRRGPLQPLVGDAQQAPPGAIGHRPLRGGSAGPFQRGVEPEDHVPRYAALAAIRGGSAVGPHQTAGAARKHRQGRTLEGGDKTSHSLSHGWAPSLS